VDACPGLARRPDGQEDLRGIGAGGFVGGASASGSEQPDGVEPVLRCAAASLTSRTGLAGILLVESRWVKPFRDSLLSPQAPASQVEHRPGGPSGACASCFNGCYLNRSETISPPPSATARLQHVASTRIAENRSVRTAAPSKPSHSPHVLRGARLPDAPFADSNA